MTSAVLRSAQAGAILTALGLTAGLMSGVTEAAPPREHSCLSSSFQESTENPNWRDVNKRYSITERIIGPPAPSTDDIPDPPGGPGCRTALAGEQWVRIVPPWITATATEQQAFIANFKGARYAIDAGTPTEQTVTAGPGILRSGNVPSDVAPAGLPWVAPVSPVFHPLSPGAHTSTLFVNMNQKVCSGLPNPALGLSATCLEAGEHEYPVADNGPFTVLTGPPPATASG
jgi:hypothetical protein